MQMRIRGPSHLGGALLLALALAGCGRDDAATPGGDSADGARAGDAMRGARRDVRAEWFRYFDDAGASYAFGATVRRYFAQRGLAAELTADGRLRVSADESVHVLDDLARQCSRLPMDAWNDAIAAHFGELSALVRLLERRTTPPWDEARDQLRVRLHTDSFLDAANADATTLVCRRDLPGLMTCVVLDEPDTALVVPRDDLDVWGRPVDAVFAIAIENTRRALQDELEVDARELPPYGTLRVVTGDSFYAATAVLWLEDWPELLGEHGAFVVAPWQRAVFAWRFDGPDDTRAVPGLYRFAERIVSEHADALAPTVYWLRPDGTFARIGIEETEDGRLAIIPPADLVPLVRDQ